VKHPAAATVVGGGGDVVGGDVVGGAVARVVGGTVALVVGGTVARVVVVGGRVAVVVGALAIDLATVVVVAFVALAFFGFPATDPIISRATNTMISHTHHR